MTAQAISPSQVSPRCGNVTLVSKTETEIKLKVDDAGKAAARIEETGARLRHPRELEDNQLYDFPDHRLMGRGAMLRVRLLERQTLLTYKDRARIEDGVKSRREVESTLPSSEGGSLTEILMGIGLEPLFRYQKYRTTWEEGDLLITLDETPIGVFIELEGGRPLIDRMASRLGYNPGEYISASYRDLYVRFLADRQGLQDRMLFTK
jgi:adenylate cyclase, class 2